MRRTNDMIRKLAFLAALAFAAPASAGQFCVSSQLSTDAAPTQYCQTVSDAGITTFAQVGAAMLLPQGVIVTPAGPNGSPAAVYRAPTVQETVNAMGTSVWVGWQANITNYQKAAAAAAAAAAVIPVQ